MKHIFEFPKSHSLFFCQYQLALFLCYFSCQRCFGVECMVCLVLTCNLMALDFLIYLSLSLSSHILPTYKDSALPIWMTFVIACASGIWVTKKKISEMRTRIKYVVSRMLLSRCCGLLSSSSKASSSRAPSSSYMEGRNLIWMVDLI